MSPDDLPWWGKVEEEREGKEVEQEITATLKIQLKRELKKEQEGYCCLSYFLRT